MKAVIYARYSSDSQREESIEGQIRECSDYAERNGITVLAHYIDRALSARTADRPEFQRMIADSETQIFDLVLVWKLDRFSRDRYDSAHYKRILKKNGVRVISVKENISEGPEGIILESMLEGYAEYYSAELSQKIQRGQHENAMKCKSNGGNIPFGLMVGENGALMMNPVTAPVVQGIYEMYDNGSTMTEIRDWLNGQGIKTNRGKNFTVGGVSVILKNRRYIGEYRYGDIVIPNGIPPIIDAELFERIQRRLAGNKKAPARAKAAEEYLLTTKLFCGKCGRMMAGESGTNGKGMTYHYYKCSGAKRKLGCNKKAVKKHWIEKAAVRLTVQRVFHEEEINRLADALVELQSRDNNILPALKNQLKECERSIDNILNAIQMGIITSSTKERLESLETQKKELLASIAQIELERPVYSKEAIIKFIYQFKGGDMDDPEYQKQIIDIFLNSIYVYDDKLVFTYNFKEGTETISLAEIEAALCSDLTCLAPPKHNHTIWCGFCFGAIINVGVRR